MDKAIGIGATFLVGFLLRDRLAGTEDRKRALSTLIFWVFLPATLLRSLALLDVSLTVLALPVFGLVCNVLLIGASACFNRRLSPDSKWGLTLGMASLAPALTVFPVLLQYGGEEAIAQAALFDVGNKIWVLGIAQYLAWVIVRDRLKDSSNSHGRGGTWEILLQPANAVILLGVILALCKLELPEAIDQWLAGLSVATAPTVGVFLGASFRPTSLSLRSDLGALLLRSGVGLACSSACLAILPQLSRIVVLALPQAGMSLWPQLYAEHWNSRSDRKLFATDRGISMLALSIPWAFAWAVGVIQFSNLSTQVFGLASLTLISASLLLSPTSKLNIR